MKKFLLILVILLTSCKPRITSTDVQTVQSIELTEAYDWQPANYKYIIITQNLVIATNVNRKIGDTIFIPE